MPHRQQNYLQAAALLLLLGNSPRFAEGGFHFRANITPQKDGAAEIRETYRFTEDSKISRMAITIFTDYEPGRFPLRCKVSDIHLKQNGIKLKPDRIIQLHEERTTILLKKVKVAELELKYKLSGCSQVLPDSSRYRISFHPYLPEEMLSATFIIQGRVLSWKTTSNDIITEKFTVHGNYAKMSPDVESSLNAFYLDFNISEKVSHRPYFTALLASLPPPVLPTLFLLLATSLILRFVPPQYKAPAMPLYLLYLALIFVTYQMQTTLYFWRLFRYMNDHNARENAVMESTLGILILIFAALYLYWWYSEKQTFRPHHWYRGFLVPMVALMLLPLVSYSLSYLLLLAGVLFSALFWFHPALALYYGVGSGKLLEEVALAGQLSILELATKYRLPAKHLTTMLGQLPGKPVVIDHEQNLLLAPALLASRPNSMLCQRCGGLTTVHSTELSLCPWCGADYAHSRTVLPRNPVPVAVATTAELVRLAGSTLAMALLLFALMGILFGFLDSFPDTDTWLMAGFVTVISLIAYLRSEKWYELLMTGKRPVGVLGVLLLGAPLILPSILLKRLFSPRAEFFFQPKKIQILQQELERKKTIPLKELAVLLQCDTAEALDVAHYICGNHLVDAVLERKDYSLIARSLFRQKATQNDCLSCGGIRTIRKGKLQCLYCGNTD